MGGPGKRVFAGQSEASLSHGSSNHLNESETSKTKRRETKRRGRTRNMALSRRKNANEKLMIDIPEGVDRIVGTNSQFAITEAGCLTRRFAPLQVTKWAKIEEDKRLGLLRDFKGSFNSGESLRCDGVIFAQMNTQYRNYRHKLYKNYFLRGITPPHVDPEDWEYLCTYFASEEYQKISKRNKENRAVQETGHVAGSKSFARICQEREQKNGDIVGPIELYKLTRYKYNEGSDEGCWVSEVAKENHEKMVMHRIERQETTEGPLDEEQICAEILGYKSGYIRGRGPGPKPNRSLSKQSYREELDEANKNAKIAQERAEKAEQQVLVFSEQLENQKCVIEELKEGLVATQRAMLESQKCTSEIMTFLQQFRQTSHVRATSPRFPARPTHSQPGIHPSVHGFALQNNQNTNNDFDVFTSEPGLRELFQEVARSYIPAATDSFNGHGSR